MLLPHQLSTVHFGNVSGAPGVGNISFWIYEFFGSRHDEVLDACFERARAVVGERLGLPPDGDWDLWDAQSGLTAEEMAAAWESVLRN